MTKSYNDRRKDYEKSRAHREPPSRRSIVQIVSDILKMMSPEDVDVPTRDVFSIPRRRVFRNYREEQDSDN